MTRQPPVARTTKTLTALPNPAPPTINEQAALRSTLGLFATGVTVITAGGPAPHGMTANAFTSVSLNPPLVLCCVSRTARLHASIVAADAFAVSILGTGQHAAARHFADWRRPAGVRQFDDVDWRPGLHTGAPVLGGALAWLECALTATHDGGDHSIFVGEVLACGRGEGAGALSYFRGDYHEVGTPGAPARKDAS